MVVGGSRREKGAGGGGRGRGTYLVWAGPFSRGSDPVTLAPQNFPMELPRKQPLSCWVSFMHNISITLPL